MNKKAMASSSVGKIILVVAVVVIFLFLLPSIPKLWNSVKPDVYGDFDGDGAALDPCPCGADNNKQQTSTGLFCVADYTASECECANKVANIGRQKDLDTKTTSPLFFVSNGKCLYKAEEGCRYLSKQNVEFNSQLKASKDPAACPIGET
jgi:hypothetical protein